MAKGGETDIALAVLLLVTYALRALLGRRARQRGQSTGVLWLAVLTIEWMALLWLTPEAAYLVFPLFFLYLHFLGR